MASTFNYFRYIVMIQLFLGLGMTLITYSLPADTLAYANVFAPEHAIDIGSTTADIELNLERQTNVPVLDIGALVFYSGNLLIDMFLNFFFAIPEAISVIANAFFMIAPIDAFIATQVKMFLFALVSIIYIFMLISFVSNVRSGTVT
ncbi:MAG: hypothetical protein SVK08_12435 [Halobacteriota archaeon]|nr:hypothetical protein [Halobacteriota archaeon]